MKVLFVSNNPTTSSETAGAGVMARADTELGVWKEPAGLDAVLGGVDGLQVNVTDLENG